ncbi:MAG: hypothetical protein GW778_06820 [Alphaproteobacteria bacterium]|nr:hypothetical protein [Alphaproteobacteria bacterium]
MKHITIKAITLISILTILPISTLNSANAKRDVISQLKENNAQFSQILNAKSDPEILLDFLHNKIDDSADITISVKNPQINNAGAIEMKLTKADYINSYLYGPRQVKNYHADIKTLNAKMDDETNTLNTKEILTESGTMLNPHDYADPGRPYSSITACESQYSVESGQPTLKKATCKTQIAYEEAV